MVWELAGFDLPSDQPLGEAGLEAEGAPHLQIAPCLQNYFSAEPWLPTEIPCSLKIVVLESSNFLVAFLRRLRGAGGCHFSSVQPAAVCHRAH